MLLSSGRHCSRCLPSGVGTGSGCFEIENFKAPYLDMLVHEVSQLLLSFVSHQPILFLLLEDETGAAKDTAELVISNVEARITLIQRGTSLQGVVIAARHSAFRVHDFGCWKRHPKYAGCLACFAFRLRWMSMIWQPTSPPACLSRGPTRHKYACIEHYPAMRPRYADMSPTIMA